ncbi:hypothetical protein B0T13DRAFT_474090 [Neurospora crassa]|nr:hypothetical protein B0T13DRAFT_474090 [Neurospora crassa]
MLHASRCRLCMQVFAWSCLFRFSSDVLLRLQLRLHLPRRVLSKVHFHGQRPHHDPQVACRLPSAPPSSISQHQSNNGVLGWVNETFAGQTHIC